MSEHISTDTWRREYPDIYDYHTFAPFYRELLRLAASKFDPQSTILDAGGGTGNLARHLRDHGCRVVLVDVSKGMVANAKSKMGTDVDYVRADLNTPLPVSAKCIDHIAALNVVYLLDRPRQFLDEAKRLLPTGGKLVVSGPKPDTSMWPLLRPVLGELVFERNLSLSDFMGMMKSFRIQSQITDEVGDENLYGLTEDDWRRYSTEAGFTVREIDPIYEGQGYLVTAEA